MAKTGLLIVTSLAKVPVSLAAANKHVFNTLLIQLYSPYIDKSPSPAFSKAVATIYASSAKWCKGLDVRVLLGNLKQTKMRKFENPIDLLLFDNCFPTNEAKRVTKSYDVSSFVNLSNDNTGGDEHFDATPADDCTVYDNVVLGGTFDRLHIGHKILLTEAILRAKKRLVVGVTDSNMIKTKKLPELILPVQQRIKEVRDFVTSVDNSLQYEIVPIQDPFGPTKTDPNLQLIVVSQETLRGGEKVNEVRAAENLSTLKVHCIDLVELEKDIDIKESKISSSNQRIDLLGTRIREPVIDQESLKNRPYIIGLIGGIASGKSKMADRFKKLGAHVIDCDKLAHTLYEPGESCYKKIISIFGASIVNETDKTIDRKKLGEIVFKDCDEMEKLNNVVWPELLKLVENIIQDIYKRDANGIVILEAAVLLKAGWQKNCHEIWSLIVTPEEAVRRIMKRNNLKEDEARLRISMQVDNDTVVKHSNVVFSSEFDDSFTQIQAERAWKMVNDYVKDLSQR